MGNQGATVKTSAAKIAAIERRQKAIELRKAGVNYDTIASALGYKDRSGAYRAVATALRAITKEDADDLRRLELARLDQMQQALWKDALQGNVAAIDRCLKIMVRRARLVGLDAPEKIDIEAQVRLSAEAEGLDPDEAVRYAQEWVKAHGSRG